MRFLGFARNHVSMAFWYCEEGAAPTQSRLTALAEKSHCGIGRFLAEML